MLENLAKLWAAVQDNVVFLLMCLGIFAGIFAAALAVEKLWLKPEKQSPARRAAYVGIFAAIAALLMYIEFPLPFAPGFYELDFSEIPVLICSFSLGPVAGVVCEFLKVVLKLFFKGTSTAFVGDLANFVIGCSFILPASAIYYFKKNKKSAVLSCITGTLILTLFGTAFNAVYLLPAFSKLFGLPLENILAMGQAVNPLMNDDSGIIGFVACCVAPMNLIKGGVVSLVTLLIYKPLSPIIKAGK